MATKKIAVSEEPAEEKAVATEKMVEVFIPMVEGEDPTVFVSVTNEVMDRDFLIRKGEPVLVPECVSEVLRASNIQQAKAREFSNSVKEQEIASY